MHSPKVVVAQRKPSQTAIRVTVVVLALGLIAWGVFQAGRTSAGHEFVSGREERRQLLNDLQRFERENADLRARLAVVERSSQVDQQAHDDLRGMLSELNDELLVLREELEFYRGIVSPADARRGLRVHDVRLESLGEPQIWRFRLVLIQAMQHDRQAQGVAQVAVAGSLDGQPHKLSLSSLGDFPDEGIPYDFRYFQEFDGDILLPERFTPNRVEVELVPRNQRDGRVEQVFDWPVT